MKRRDRAFGRSLAWVGMLAAVVACRGKDPPSGASSASTSTSSAAAPAASASAAMTPAPRLPPYGFELGKGVINPKVDDKAVILGADGGCYTLGAIEPGTRPPRFAHLRVDCPPGVSTPLGSCPGGVAHRRGDRCSCLLPEGGVPAPSKPIACP